MVYPTRMQVHVTFIEHPVNFRGSTQRIEISLWQQSAECTTASETTSHLQQVIPRCYSVNLSKLIATCQWHTPCFEAYCLRTCRGKQACHFRYPKPLQRKTAIVTEDKPTLLTACNDGMIISYNLFSSHSMACQCGHAVYCLQTSSH